MMNLLAKILSHGFAVAIVALLALGYIYRGELFPEFDIPEQLGFGSGTSTEIKSGQADTTVASEPAEAETATPIAEDVPEAAPITAEQPPADTATPVADATPEPAQETTQEPVAESATESAAEPETSQAPEETADAAAATPATDTDTGDVPEPEAEIQAPDVPPVADAPEEAVAAEPATPAVEETAVSTVAPADTAPEDRSANQILADAREAFWLRDHATAESHYQQLIAAQPDNPDGYGELGNMYFSQGEWEKAASAYFEAGTRLVNERLFAQAGELVEVIRGLNGSQADELAQLIAAAR